MKDSVRKPNIWCAAVVGLCFLLTSTAYLAWTYHVRELLPPRAVDAAALSFGYLFQAAGIGLFALFVRRKRAQVKPALFVVLFLTILCLIPSVTPNFPALLLSSGFLLNLLLGWIAGTYLYCLTFYCDSKNRAVTLGCGYSISIILSWLLEMPGHGSLYNTSRILPVCLAMCGAIIFTMQRGHSLRQDETAETKQESRPHMADSDQTLSMKSFLLPVGTLVLVFSIVNSCGFGFPSVDLQVGISLEFSRLFYAAGLIIAGIINDKHRRYGAVCALAALIIPFIMLALKGRQVSEMFFWALSYFTFGFYSIYRMILFADTAAQKNIPWLAGFGLLIGRVGDAAGEALNLLLSEHFTVLTIVSAVMFVISVVLFLYVYKLIYLSEIVQVPQPERDLFSHFSAAYDLSVREREVLRLIILEKKSPEIAEALSVSDSTVKYHIHNILQKTGCKNRIALLSAYTTWQIPTVVPSKHPLT